MSLNATVLGAGFIGRNFIRQALRLGYNLRVLDHHSCPAEFEGRLTWLKGDARQAPELSEALLGADIVFHFLSSTVPGDAVDESLELRDNVFQTLQLLKLCVQMHVARIVFASSSSVYGVQSILPIPETAPTNPISSHGINKLTIEKYLLLYKQHHGLNCKILRIANPYGQGQNLRGRQGFIGIAIGRILDGKPINIRGDGNVVRDFVHICDVSNAIHLIANDPSDRSVFNVGYGHGYSLNEVINIMRELLGRDVQVKYSQARYIDIPNSVLDISKADTILSFRPQYSLVEGLKNTLRNFDVISSGR